MSKNLKNNKQFFNFIFTQFSFLFYLVISIMMTTICKVIDYNKYYKLIEALKYNS